MPFSSSTNEYGQLKSEPNPTERMKPSSMRISRTPIVWQELSSPIVHLDAHTTTSPPFACAHLMAFHQSEKKRMVPVVDCKKARA